MTIDINKNKFKNFPFHVFLGIDKETGYKIYLEGFSWDCKWYYGGGYLSYYNRVGRPTLYIHTHFDTVFLTGERGASKAPIWENLDKFVDNPQFDSNQWWRIKDLYKQFYALRECAEVFQYGGHCTPRNRNPKEINKDMANKINTHIQDVIIPEIIKALNVNNKEKKK